MHLYANHLWLDDKNPDSTWEELKCLSIVDWLLMDYFFKHRWPILLCFPVIFLL